MNILYQDLDIPSRFRLFFHSHSKIEEKLVPYICFEKYDLEGLGNTFWPLDSCFKPKHKQMYQKQVKKSFVKLLPPNLPEVFSANVLGCGGGVWCPWWKCPWNWIPTPSLLTQWPKKSSYSFCLSMIFTLISQVLHVCLQIKLRYFPFLSSS